MARYLLLGITLLLMTACADSPSMLDPRGPNAAAIATAWWIMFWGAVVILAVVTALALLALYRKDGPRSPSANALIAVGGLAFPVATLTALLVYAFNIETEPPANGEPLTIEVTGHRWWWEVRYPGAAPVVTANEIHIPAGRPIQLRLQTADVIHSFWVPQLGGKQDLIPGHVKKLTLQADAPGSYRGQCAEFCGLQHAHMALWVYALPAEEFDAWRAGRANSQPTAPDAAAQRGRARFIAQRCAECHTVRGTAAQIDVGPDLTHVGSRAFLGAGTLRNKPGAIVSWIARHQQIKPGNHCMARFDRLSPEQTSEIAAWLEQLR